MLHYINVKATSLNQWYQISVKIRYILSVNKLTMADLIITWQPSLLHSASTCWFWISTRNTFTLYIWREVRQNFANVNSKKRLMHIHLNRSSSIDTASHALMCSHCTNNTVGISPTISIKTCRITLFILLIKKQFEFWSYVYY